MGKKAILFILIGVVVGLAGGIAGAFFMIDQSKPPEEPVVEEFDLKDGARLTLEKVQIVLPQVDANKSFLQADFTIVFKTAEALALAEGMQADIKDAILGVFETKTYDELNQTGARNDMKEPVLEAIRGLYNNEEDRENIMAIMISNFILTKV